MTNEELKRIRLYAWKIKAAGGDLSVLRDEQSRHLEILVKRRLCESEAERSKGYVTEG